METSIKRQKKAEQQVKDNRRSSKIERNKTSLGRITQYKSSLLIFN